MEEFSSFLPPFTSEDILLNLYENHQLQSGEICYVNKVWYSASKNAKKMI
jgi:hypothetical protein